MTYTQTLTYLYAQLPMYQRIGIAAYKSDLDNTIAICKILKNPEKKIRCIHIAGTNGKGSTSHMLASILQEAGYKVGLYTSPHLIDFRERIKINGKQISKKHIIDFVAKHKQDFEKINPSFFEWTVGLAFNYFEQQRVDIAVIEVGLGGRLDSTNVLTPILSIITNIAKDHTNLLGKTYKKIAFEKAGIIKKNIPIVIGETNKITKSVFLAKANEQKAPIYFSKDFIKIIKHKQNTNGIHADIEIFYKELKTTQVYSLELKGLYQAKNLNTVLLAVKLLQKKLSITELHLKNGLKNVVTNTQLLGRWQTISNNPKIIADTGHNEAGIAEVIKCLDNEFKAKISTKKLHFVIAVVNDKDVNALIRQLSAHNLTKNALYYVSEAQIPRALACEELALYFKNTALQYKKYSNIGLAIKAAQNNYRLGDLIFIGGSTFTVADALIFFKNNL